MAGGRRDRRPRDRADEGHADVASHRRNDRPIEASFGAPRRPGRPGAGGGRGTGERHGPKRQRIRGGIPGFRLPLVRLPAPREEPRDQRPPEAPAKRGLRGGPPGGDLPRGDPRELGHLAGATRRYGTPDRDRLQRRRAGHRAEESPRPDQETRDARRGPGGARRGHRVEGRGPEDLPRPERPRSGGDRLSRSRPGGRPNDVVRRIRFLAGTDRRGAREVRSFADGTKTEVLGRLVRLGRTGRERL